MKCVLSSLPIVSIDSLNSITFIYSYKLHISILKWVPWFLSQQAVTHLTKLTFLKMYLWLNKSEISINV